MNDKKLIILFDGVCNFCNFWVNFVIKRDKQDLFRFAAFQSDVTKEILTKFNLDHIKQESVILISEDNVYFKSTAALMICKQLFGPVKFLFLLIIIPKFIRDFLYNLFAKYRYKIFGRSEICRVPTESEKLKFLD